MKRRSKLLYDPESRVKGICSVGAAAVGEIAAGVGTAAAVDSGLAIAGGTLVGAGTLGGIAAADAGLAGIAGFAGGAGLAGTSAAAAGGLGGMFGSGALSAGASLANGLMQSNSARGAAQTQQQAANNATALQQNIYDTNQANLAPFITNGAQATNTLASYLKDGTLGGKFTNADLNANLAPNYQFQLQQGEQALQNSQAARDGIMGGAAQKEMQNFVQGTAAGAYQNAYNNWLSTQQNTYNQLAQLGGLGENAAAMQGNTGANIGSNIASTQIGAANAQAASQIAGANALSGGVNNALGYYTLGNLTNH